MPDSLVVEATCVRYGSHEQLMLAELEQELSRQSSLPPVVIRQPSDALLSLDGLVQQRYRFTHRGLSSLCSRLVQGLPGPISRIAGLTGADRDPTARPELAVRILNAVIRDLFAERLADCRFVIDPTRNAIEGVVSSRYEYLSNSDWLASCQNFAIRYAGNSARFLSATMTGRRMLVRYVDDRDWLTVETGDGGQDHYRRGWSFSNSETGDAAVRVGLLIVDASDNSAMRSMGRCTHTKALRESKGEDLLVKLRTACDQINHELIARNLRRLHEKPLPTVGALPELTRVSSLLSTQLGRRIPKNIARAVVNAALSPQIYLPTATDSPLTPQSFSPIDHSYYHLYFALTAQARGCFPREQENVEQLAYLLLRGKLILSAQ